MAAFTQIVEQASDILWNYLLLFLLSGGVFALIAFAQPYLMKKAILIRRKENHGKTYAES